MPHRLVALLILFTAFVASCNGGAKPTVIEFSAPAGNFRVTAPADWVESAVVAGRSGVQSPAGDLIFTVFTIDVVPGQVTNPRQYVENERRFTVYDGIDGSLKAEVGVAGHSYGAVLLRLPSTEHPPLHEEIFVDMVASLEVLK